MEGKTESPLRLKIRFPLLVLELSKGRNKKLSTDWVYCRGKSKKRGELPDSLVLNQGKKKGE